MSTLGSHVYECHPGDTGNWQNCTGEFNLYPKYSWHIWLQRRAIQPRSLIPRNMSSGFFCFKDLLNNVPDFLTNTFGDRNEKVESRRDHCVFFSDLIWPMTKSSISVFTVYVLSQTLTNAARLMPLKWTNAIRMHLAIIPRAHTNVLAILRVLGMVLIVKIRLVFYMHESDEIYILFPMLNVAVYCLELTFIRNSYRRCWLSSEIHVEDIYIEET